MGESVPLAIAFTCMSLAYYFSTVQCSNHAERRPSILLYAALMLSRIGVQARGLNPETAIICSSSTLAISPHCSDRPENFEIVSLFISVDVAVILGSARGGSRMVG